MQILNTIEGQILTEIAWVFWLIILVFWLITLTAVVILVFFDRGNK